MSSEIHSFEIERSGAPGDEPRCCDWPGCGEQGEHRAPRSRQNLKSYHWFCLDHVRAYNKSWNYYEGMNEDEVEADVREDTVWRRPSWPLGAAKLAYAFEATDGLGPINGSKSSRKGTEKTHRRAVTHLEKSMAVLDLLPPVTVNAVKARYKELVKRHHPDANGGAKTSEEKFKQISQAYETIMSCLAD